MKSTSLTARLTTVFALIIVVCFVIVGSILYDGLEDEVYKANDMSIVLAGRHLRRLAAEMDDVSDVREHQARLVSLVLGDAALALQVQTADHAPLIDYNPPHLDFIRLTPVPASERIVPEQLAHWNFSGELPARGVATRAKLRNGTEIEIAVARSMQDREAMLGRYLALIWGTGLATVLTAVGASFLFIRKALEPLRAVATAAREISTDRLDARIDNQHAPREFQQLIESLNAMLHRLEKGFARMWEFTTDLAHDLRTPVANMRGASEVALARTRSTAEYQAQLASTIEECDRMGRMIENVLFLARAESPHFELARVPLQAAAELQRVADYFEGLAEEQGIRIAVHGEAQVNAERELFRRAVNNLLANALRYTPAGGVIQLSATTTAQESIVAVENPGPGIPAEQLPLIFDRFYRGDRARSSASGSSSGLGLAIVKTIMDLHQGRASVSSEPGDKTIFQLHFPH